MGYYTPCFNSKYINTIDDCNNITKNKIGYHISDIPKGIPYTSSKILEEVYELIDSEQQQNKIMALLEISDIYGALELYIEKNFSEFTMDDIKIMANATKRAFINGYRT